MRSAVAIKHIGITLMPESTGRSSVELQGADFRTGSIVIVAQWGTHPNAI